ncbi:MAG: hypothetical protein V2A77_02705 [Pseudomonadota bacterium]
MDLVNPTTYACQIGPETVIAGAYVGEIGVAAQRSHDRAAPRW